MIQSCNRCGHIAGAQCPFCGRTDPLVMSWIEGYRYCGVVDGCFIDQLADNEALEEGYGTSQIIDLEPPMTTEEEEMH